MLRPLAGVEVGFLERPKAEEIERVITPEIYPGIDRLAVRLDNVPYIARNDVTKLGVDSRDGAMRILLEVAYENTGSQDGVVRVFRRERHGSVGGDLVQRLRLDSVVNGRTGMFRHATDVSCGNWR